MTLNASNYLFPYHFNSRDMAVEAKSYVLSGGNPSVVDSSTINVTSGNGFSDGSSVSWPSTDISITTPSSNPRKDLIVVQSDGTVTNLAGSEAAPIPSNKTGPDTQEPVPPTLNNNETVLAEAWITTGGVQNVYDRRILVDLDPINEIHAEMAGHVRNNDAANIYSIGLADGETLRVYQAALTLSDGQAAPSGVDLVIATLDNSGGGTSQSTLISGDGSTIYDDRRGYPLGSYTNSTGNSQTVGILVDNGNWNAGSGSYQDVYGLAKGDVR